MSRNTKCGSWDELMDILYSSEDREKIEWSIGAALSGDRFSRVLILYGPFRSGKTTTLNIIRSVMEHASGVKVMDGVSDSSEIPDTHSSFIFVGTNSPPNKKNPKHLVINTVRNENPEELYKELYWRVYFELDAVSRRCSDVYQALGSSYYDV